MKSKIKNSVGKEKSLEKSVDKSPYVFQRSKIEYNLNIKDLPWTENQLTAIQILKSKQTKAVFLKGVAGTGKTLLAMYAALHLLNEKKISDLILVRTAVESADSSLGFLPGDLNDKFGVYTTPFHDKLSELLDANQIKVLDKEKRLIEMPINFARGQHWAAKCVIADEAQNFTKRELITLMTRMGEFGRLFILGDPMQTDLHPSKGGAFAEACNLFDDEESRNAGIYVLEFTDADIVRSEFVKFIIKKFK